MLKWRVVKRGGVMGEEDPFDIMSYIVGMNTKVYVCPTFHVIWPVDKALNTMTSSPYKEKKKKKKMCHLLGGCLLTQI